MDDFLIFQIEIGIALPRILLPFNFFWFIKHSKISTFIFIKFKNI